MPLSVLLITPHFIPRYIGGVEKYTKSLADELLARGHRPQIVCVENFSPSLEAPRAAVDTSRDYPVIRLDLPQPRSVAEALDADGSPALREWFRRWLGNEHVDVVHVQSGYLLGRAALQAAVDARIPSAITLHDYWAICPRITLEHPDGSACAGPDSAAKCGWCLRSNMRRHRWLDRLTAGAYRRAATRVWALKLTARARVSIAAVSGRRVAVRDSLATAGLLVTLSRASARLLASWDVVNEPTLTLTHGVAQPPSRRTPSLDGVLRVGYVGQIKPHKGVHVLLEAVRNVAHPGLRVTIHGDLAADPSYARRLRALANGDSRVEFAGAFPPGESATVYSALDALVIPSLWPEVVGLVALEARAAGVPVVAARVGGLPEQVEEGRTGLLFNRGDSRGLQRILVDLLEDRSLVERLSANSLPRKTFDGAVDELISHYERLKASA